MNNSIKNSHTMTFDMRFIADIETDSWTLGTMLNTGTDWLGCLVSACLLMSYVRSSLLAICTTNQL